MKPTGFSGLNLDGHTLRVIDYGVLLADLRSGIRSVTISNYTGDVKLSTRRDRTGEAPVNVSAQEEVRGGRPYFLSPVKGKRRVLPKGKRQGCRITGLTSAIGNRSRHVPGRKCDLRKKILIEWVNERESERVCPDTTGLPESSPEATAFGSNEGPLPDTPWQGVERLCPETPVEPWVLNFFEK
ncbi:MAG: hypothetical protein OXF02_02310 [Simkaniaceae bacterium]|nr:hypothetical protein [Simkaniaceae bacterium]